MSLLTRTSLAVLAVLLLSAVAAPASATEGLGRLFLTPAQRLDLDRRRQADAQDSIVSSDNFVTVNGKVSRSSGKTTTWINRKPQHDQTRSTDPARVSVPNGEDQPPIPLKIGETLDKARGEKKDIVGEGQVRVPAAKR
jgi:hypothetical protein